MNTRARHDGERGKEASEERSEEGEGERRCAML